MQTTSRTRQSMPAWVVPVAIAAALGLAAAGLTLRAPPAPAPALKTSFESIPALRLALRLETVDAALARLPAPAGACKLELGHPLRCRSTWQAGCAVDLAGVGGRGRQLAGTRWRRPRAQPRRVARDRCASAGVGASARAGSSDRPLATGARTAGLAHCADRTPGVGGGRDGHRPGASRRSGGGLCAGRGRRLHTGMAMAVPRRGTDTNRRLAWRARAP